MPSPEGDHIMDSAFIYRAANELVKNAGTRNIKEIARSCSLDISETSRIKDILGLLLSDEFSTASSLCISAAALLRHWSSLFLYWESTRLFYKAGTKWRRLWRVSGCLQLRVWRFCSPVFLCILQKCFLLFPPLQIHTHLPWWAVFLLWSLRSER